jgi:hypothetical protein
MEPGTEAGEDGASLAGCLAALGCPADKADAMAAQLHKRAAQLALQKGVSHTDALSHLLNLLRQGWAAQAQAGRSDSAPIPTAEEESNRLPAIPLPPPAGP